MAKVSLDNGFVRMANPIVMKLQSFRIPGQSHQCFWVIVGKTWGWGKKEDDISISQFVKATGLSPSNIIGSLDLLDEINMIGRKKNIAESGRFLPTTYWVQKDVDLWISRPKKMRGVLNLVLPKAVVPEKEKEYYQIEVKGTTKSSSNTVLPNLVDTKDIYKDTNTKDIAKKVSQQTGLSDIQIENLEELFNEVTGRISQKKRRVSFFRPIILGKIKKLVEMDEKYTYEDMARVIVVMASWWLEDPKMKQYLFPETLFRPSHFHKYVCMEPKDVEFSDNKKTDANLKASFSWLEKQGINYNELKEES